MLPALARAAARSKKNSAPQPWTLPERPPHTYGISQIAACANSREIQPCSHNLNSIKLHQSASLRISGRTNQFRPAIVPAQLQAMRELLLLVLLTALPEAAALDLAIVGAGPVGTSAALRAAELGKSVALIDAPEFSGALSAADGEDLSFGAPSGLFSKALRDTAKKFSVETLRQMGLDDTSIWDQIKFSCASLARANARAAFLDVESAGVEYIRGKAVLTDGGQTVCIDNQRKLAPDNILLCTGSRPFRIPGIPFDGERIFESDSINTLTYLPKSIAITGSGIVAIEFAQIFASLGAEVTLIVRDQNPARALSKIGLDKDIAAAVLADLKAKKIRTVKGAEAVAFEVPERPRPVVVKLQAPGGGPVKGSVQELRVDAYLAAVGRKPNTDNLARRRAESSRRPPRHRRVLISVDFPRRASRRPA